ncbi:MAG: cytochrome c biogenesis protein ResB [Microcystaceae cyanobacterium]
MFIKPNSILRFFGSIKLAVPLLSIIILILIGATFYESQVGSSYVQQFIYKSPWFGALMFLLAINLGISALLRYPWKGTRKIGFAITHFGLVVIIAGSAAVIHLGVEGMLLLRIGEPASHQIRVEGDLLEVIDADGTIQQSSIQINPDNSVAPQKLGNLSLLNYTENATKAVNFIEDQTVNNSAVHLSLSSSRMGQNVGQWLAIAPLGFDTIQLGLAELSIQEVNNQQELQSYLNPPLDKALSPYGVLNLKLKKQQKQIDVQSSLSQIINFKNIQISIQAFWSDFRLDRNNQPVSASSTFNNPAIQLELTTPNGKERWFLFGKDNLNPVRTLISGEIEPNIDITYEIEPQKPQNYLQILVTPDDSLYYAVNSRNGFQSGKLTTGDKIIPKWADFEIMLDTYLPHAQLQRLVIPNPNSQQTGFPALLVQTEDKKEAWLPWGEPTVIEDNNIEYFAAFSPKLMQIPFDIQLTDFIVERNEGDESVAMWTSRIRIQDPENKIMVKRNVWMNHPTWYKGWKIAQSSWNPNDLSQSTLQIKREPLWVTGLTWTGSTLVVLGIIIMFYGSSFRPIDFGEREQIIDKMKS